MIIAPWERRAAQRFDELLNTDRPPAHDELTPLVAIPSRLNEMGRGVGIDPAFRDRLRTRLVAVAQVHGVGTETDTPPASKRRVSLPRRAALLSGTLAVLIGLSGVGVASNGAVPGDALYSVKRSREAAQLALAQSDSSRGQLHLQFARTRLTEASSVRSDSAELSRALDDMDADTRSAMRELGSVAVSRKSTAALDSVDEFVVGQRQDLMALISELSVDRRARPMSSLALVEQVAERSTSLRESLNCGNASENTRTDELGPLPRRCAAMPAVEAGGRNAPPGTSGRSAEPETPAAGDPTPSPSVSPSTSSALSSTESKPGSGTPSVTTPAQTEGADGILGSVTGTVGGVLGGLLGPLLGQ